MQSGSLWSGNHRRLFQYLVKRLTGGYFTQQQNSSTGRAEHNSLGSEILKANGIAQWAKIANSGSSRHP